MKNQSYTYGEIMNQADCWEKVYNKIGEKRFNLDKKIFSRDFDEIILFGCGSSYNISMSAAFYTNALLDRKACAVPSSELIFSKDVYIKEDKKYLLVGFSRSGETTESIKVLEGLSNRKNVSSLVFTCSEDNSLMKISDNYFYCDGAEEKSIVMTKSFSSMLFAYCMVLAKYLNNEVLISEFCLLINYMKKNLSSLFKNLEYFVDKVCFDKFFALGNGFNYGLSVEADLKVKEMTQMPSYSYSIMEFSHGPISLMDNRSLIFFMTLEKYFNEYKYLISENFLKSDFRVIFIGKNELVRDSNDKVINLLNDENFHNEFARSFINIPAFQILAYYKTLQNGLNPDKPRNLSYTTKII